MRARMLRRKAPLLWTAVVLCATVGLARTQPAVVWAATMTVDSPTDAADANLDDGICATSTGACTLRAALQEANARSGPDTITVPPGIYTLTRAGADDQASSGDLDITDDVTIVGAGRTATVIDGGAIDRVFETWNLSTSVAIAHLTIRNGQASNSSGGGLVTRSQTTLDDLAISGNMADGDGGGISVLEGNLILTNVTVSGNFSIYSSGGGIANWGVLTLNSSVVDNNVACEEAGGIMNVGILMLNNSAVRNNGTGDGYGGGIVNWRNATLTNSSVSNNSAVGGIGGGGIVNSGTLSIDRSTISGNTTDASGGGILVPNFYGGWQTGVLEITNSTISNNTAAAGVGGIASFGIPMRLESSTITDNTGGMVGGIANTGSGTLTIQNTIVAGNSGSAPDCSGSLTSQGYNLIGTTTGCTFAAAAGDQLGTDASPIDPKLGPLQQNGGPTLTHALLPESPAIDAINGTCPIVDQRAARRPQDGDGDGVPLCDIGAYEYRVPVAPTATRTQTASPTMTNIPTSTPTGSVPATPTVTPTSSPTRTPTTTPTRVVVSRPLYLPLIAHVGP